MVEIVGIATKVGKIKEYDNRWGKSTKFFLSVDDSQGIEHKTMVETKSLFPDCCERSRPFTGDKVRYTTRSEKDGWGSTTLKQEFEVLDNLGERRWKAEKKAEWENEKEKRKKEFEKEKEESEKRKKQEWKEWQEEISKMPKKIREVIADKKLMSKTRLIAVLRDTFWLGPIPMGEGGMRDDWGHGGGYPGTGMRRPDGCFYNMPESHRESVLNSLIKADLIEDVKGYYKATESGVELLKSMDICPKCNTHRQPYREMCFTQTGPNHGIRNDWIGFLCLCQHKKLSSLHSSAWGGSKSGVGKRIKEDIDWNKDKCLPVSRCNYCEHKGYELGAYYCKAKNDNEDSYISPDEFVKDCDRFERKKGKSQCVMCQHNKCHPPENCRSGRMFAHWECTFDGHLIGPEEWERGCTVNAYKEIIFGRD